MVSVEPKDCDVLRYLWVKDVTVDEPEIVTLRFSRVVFGVSSSPFLLNVTLQYHVKKYAEAQPTVVGKLLKSMLMTWLEELTLRSKPTSSTRDPSSC